MQHSPMRQFLERVGGARLIDFVDDLPSRCVTNVLRRARRPLAGDHDPAALTAPHNSERRPHPLCRKATTSGSLAQRSSLGSSSRRQGDSGMAPTRPPESGLPCPEEDLNRWPLVMTPSSTGANVAGYGAQMKAKPPAVASSARTDPSPYEQVIPEGAGPVKSVCRAIFLPRPGYCARRERGRGPGSGGARPRSNAA